MAAPGDSKKAMTGEKIMKENELLTPWMTGIGRLKTELSTDEGVTAG